MSEKKGSRLEADPLFLVEYMKATITSDIFTVMEEESISKTELANRLGKSRQYVSRILNETANYTLDSIAKIAAALKRDVALRLLSYEDEMVIRPFIKQQEYWFHDTQDFDTSTEKIAMDSRKDVSYHESALCEPFVVAEDSVAYTAREGA
jgi:transcriptional regulator with XRE-family HTH domain